MDNRQQPSIAANVSNSTNRDGSRVNGNKPPVPGSRWNWRGRYRKRDPEAQLKGADANTDVTDLQNGLQHGVRVPTRPINFKSKYDTFQEDFRNELYSRKVSEQWSDEKLMYLIDKYLGESYPVGDTTDPTYDAHGYIVYFKQGTDQPLEQKLPIRGMTFTTDSFTEMENAWEQRQREAGKPLEPPDVRWIHLPANNMKWVEEAMLNILKLYHKPASGDDVSAMRAREVRDNILQRDYWQHRSNRSLEGKIWGRYMKPFARCIKPPPGEGDFSPGLNASTLAVYMPYLHWERNAAAAYMRHIAQDVYEHFPISYRFENDRTTEPVAKLAQHGASVDERLLRRYLRCKQHLHIRHTLDQFFHPYLRDFSDRDFDQVVERYARRYNLEEYSEFKNESPILMVDQLWLWVIGDDTILTCFPTTWGVEEGLADPLDVRDKIMFNLEKPNNHTSFELAPLVANIIIDQCAANMLEPSMLVHERHKFLNFFEQSTTVLMERQTRSLKKLLCMSTPDRLTAHEKLLDTTEEFSMLDEGRDIEEELKIIRVVLDRQEDTFRQLQKAFGKYQDHQTMSSRLTIEKLILGLVTRRKAVDKLMKGVQSVNEQILQLLGLKQQQASISEARSSRVLAEQGDRQSASMMLFTVVTILFLPLSTMTSFFGMNNVEMGSGNLSLGRVVAYVFPISAVCVFISFFLGFNHQARRTFLMWLDYIAESMTGLDRNYFWAAREKSIELRLKNKRKEKRAKLRRLKQRRAEAEAEDPEGDGSDEMERSEFLPPAYRARISPRSSISSSYGPGDNLIEDRKPRPRTGSQSTSHIYTSGPDTEEEVSDRAVSPDSRLSPPRSSRPSALSGVRPIFHPSLLNNPDNETVILDDHTDAIPSITVQAQDIRNAQQHPSTSIGLALQQASFGERTASPGRGGTRLREATMLRQASQASQQREARNSGGSPLASPRNSLPEVSQLVIGGGTDSHQDDMNIDGEALERPRTRSV